tara:strand:+ start:2811 stop:3611 length:801 start_codon:yes stop_codon:yes gene_type:complete
MKIGFLGAGKMAEAIIAALVERRVVKACDVFAADIASARRRSLKRRLGINTSAVNAEIVGNCSVLVLAVKPQHLAEVVAEIAPRLTRRHLLISIAAGVTTADLESWAPGARVVRVMPNLACTVGRSMSVYTCGAHAKASDRKTAARLFASCGEVVELAEKHFDAVTALSGSGPAFFAYVADRLAAAAIAEGLDADVALLLAEQTMLGTADLLIQTGTKPADLIAAVSSAKGTTAEGMKVLKGSDVSRVMRDTIRAAARRSRELSGR